MRENQVSFGARGACTIRNASASVLQRYVQYGTLFLHGIFPRKCFTMIDFCHNGKSKAQGTMICFENKLLSIQAKYYTDGELAKKAESCKIAALI